MVHKIFVCGSAEMWSWFNGWKICENLIKFLIVIELFFYGKKMEIKLEFWCCLNASDS